MDKKQGVEKLLLEQKLLPLYYHPDPELSVELMKAIYEAGVRIFEYTNRGEYALNNFIRLKKASLELPGIKVGIGTIKNTKSAAEFIDAGADFIVCPAVSEAVADLVHKHQLLWIPGCMTPTEIVTAEEAGARIVKIFPGNILGPGYIKSISELFPAIKFMPTGGVEPDIVNLKSWFDSGVVAVGMGSKLFSPELVASKNFQGIKENTRSVLALIGEAAAIEPNKP